MDGLTGRSLVASNAEEPYLKTDYPPHDAFGLQEIYRVLLRRRLIVGGICAAFVLVGALYAFLRPPMYEATSVLMLRPSEPRVTETAANAPEPDAGYIESQVEILRSRVLARQLVDRLGLAEQWGSGSTDLARRASAANAVADAISVSRRDGTYIVEVSAKARDPETAARLANDLVTVYYASREQARIEYATQTSGWLSSRLAELRNEVKLREDEVERYRAEHGLLMVEGTMLAEQQLRDAEASVVAARADLAERQARYRQARSLAQRGATAETTASALSSEVMAQLRAQQADVNRRLAEYEDRYGELHPAVHAARAERADINRQIREEVGRIAQNLNEEAQIASARVSTLQGHLSSVRGQLVGNNTEQVRLRELERNAQAARAVYENFLLRYHEVSDTAGGLGGDAQVVASAEPPLEPASRSPMLILALAAALGLAAGALVAFLMEQFTTTLQTADDIDHKIGLPILTSIPEIEQRGLARLAPTEQHPPGFVVAKPMSAFAESMRMLRARISHAGLSQGVKIVAVTSSLAGEGKSSTALSLARVTALSGRKVMLIDCDLRRRSLNHMLCIEPIAGITQVLRGQKSWREVAGQDEYSGAHILPAALEEFSSEDLFNSDRMRELMSELSGLYDLVVLDCPPILTLAEVRDLATLADGVVVVARRNKTEVMALQTAINELRAVNATILGVAFNGVDVNAPGRFSYADPLYFSHAEKDMYVA